MATLATIVARQPQQYQDRYADAYWIKWANGLLSELDAAQMMPSSKVERGAVVANKVWIDRPSDLVALHKIWSASYPIREFNWKDVDGKLLLLDGSIDEDEDSVTSSVISAQAVGSITTDLDDADEDDYKDYLLVVTAGTFAGNTYLLSGNDESAGGTTKLNFLHDLSAAFAVAEVTAIQLISPEHYAMLYYTRALPELTSTAGEFPILNQYENRVVDTYLSWMAERESAAYSQESQDAMNMFDRSMLMLKATVRGGPKGPIRGRFMPKIG